MSLHSTTEVLDFDRVFSGQGERRNPKVEVEVILIEIGEAHYRIRNDETAPPRNIPRRGIKVVEKRGSYATLELTERKAVDLNLI